MYMYAQQILHIVIIFSSNPQETETNEGSVACPSFPPLAIRGIRTHGENLI